LRADRLLTQAIARDQLRENALLKKYYCDVNLSDLIKYNEELAHRLVNEPAEIIPLVCTPIENAGKHSLTPTSSKPR
jgi:DNA replicative helicase MCM subunit Mcm2 (Cdc46/Mcm family)